MESSLAAESLFHIGPLAVTNSMVVSWAVGLFFIILSLFVYYGYSHLPTKLKITLEIILEGLMGLVEGVAGPKARDFFPLIATFFLYILFSNLTGIIPGVGTIGFHMELHGQERFIPILRGPTADLNTTLALAIVSVAAAQLYSIKYLGFKGWLSRFFNFKNPISFFMGILDIVTEFAKIISFSFRLFGNIFAGEVLLAVMLFLIPFIVPVPFIGLEIFVAFIQALVFSMLSLVFITVASERSQH